MSIGDRVRKARKKNGLTQQQLGELIGTSQQAIFKIENGGTYTTSYLIPIAKCLGVDPFWLESGENEATSTTQSIALSSDELKLIALYRALSDENKKTLHKLSSALVE